jgi:hypothetical protein
MRYFYLEDGAQIFVPLEGNGITLLGETNQPTDERIASDEREVLRRLAGQVAELAARPVEDAKRALWRRLNGLQSARPVVFCDPENAWSEIVPAESLSCRHELARAWEFTLRREVFWGAEIGDDRVVNPYFALPYIYAQSDWGLREERHGGGDGTGYAWRPALADWSDIDQIHAPRIAVDHAATERIRALADATFGDLLPARVDMIWLWTQGLTQPLSLLRGMGQMMFDMMDAPEQLHRLMQRLQAATLERMAFLEASNLLCLNNNGTYVGSGGFGWTDELPQADFAGHVRLRDLWGFCESQETVGISPRMFDEFVLQYQLPILARFGLVCYGCCEPLEKRWPYIEKIPRLRRVSVSPFANSGRMAELLGDRYVFSLKPNPVDLAGDHFDEDAIRTGLRRKLQAARNCHIEIIMKDTHTLRCDPRRAIRWTQIARAEAERL